MKMISSRVGRSLLGIALIAAGLAIAFLTGRTDLFAGFLVACGLLAIDPSILAGVVKNAVELLRAKSGGGA